jgi:hypothetical protein
MVLIQWMQPSDRNHSSLHTDAPEPLVIAIMLKVI